MWPALPAFDDIPTITTEVGRISISTTVFITIPMFDQCLRVLLSKSGCAFNSGMRQESEQFLHFFLRLLRMGAEYFADALSVFFGPLLLGRIKKDPPSGGS
jgi:hypothetical protein